MNHLEAKALVDNEVTNPGHSLLVRVVSWLETNYGTKSAQPSANNWGNILAGKGAANFFTMVDGLPGAKEPRRFAVYSSPKEGANAVYSLLARRYPKALEAAERDDWEGVAKGMRDGVGGYSYAEALTSPKYFRQYADGLKNVAKTIRKATGEVPPPSGGMAGGIIAVAVILGVAWLGRNV